MVLETDPYLLRSRTCYNAGMEDMRQIAAHIEHTNLMPLAIERDIEQLCAEAVQWGFGGVCVAGVWVPLAARLLEGKGPRVVTVAGFPLGATHREAKAYESRRAVAHGAHEVDMVVNLGALKQGDDRAVYQDVAAVVGAVRLERPDALVKVIIETGYLSHEEKARACRLAAEAGADFVKTSTGFGPGGASVADVEIMRKAAGPAVRVKASGGIRTREQALALIAAGAARLGTSAGIAIVSAAGEASNAGAARE